MTYRTNAASGSAVDVTDYVGGHDPATADAGNAARDGCSTARPAPSPAAVRARRTLSRRPARHGQYHRHGLRLELRHDREHERHRPGEPAAVYHQRQPPGRRCSLAQSGLVAANENAVFMISNGTAAAGLRPPTTTFRAAWPRSARLPACRPFQPVVIDAQKQPGWTSAPIVELNGTSAAANGLVISGGSSTVRGLIINRFNSWYGIQITTNGGNTIAGNYIGISAAGAATTPKLFAGIRIDGTASNTIGGTTATDRNVIGRGLSRRH